MIETNLNEQLFIYIERGYIRKTGVQFGEVTVGLASKTLRYPFEFLMKKMSFRSIKWKYQNKDNEPKLVKY